MPSARAVACGQRHAAIEKRISRAKKVLAGSKQLFDITNDVADFPTRLSSVQRALYLLFNEGYHGASPESAVRVELCQEAARLTGLLLEHKPAATPASFALAALMCLHAARLPGRLDELGNLTSFLAQDRSRWDMKLVSQGQALLELSATGPELTEYHVEAAIAATHCCALNVEDTDWGRIVWLYDKLMSIRASPVIGLNRAIAIAQHEGPERGLEEIQAIAECERLARYPFYPAAMGELEFRCGRHEVAARHFRDALALARSPIERRFLEGRVTASEDECSTRA